MVRVAAIQLCSGLDRQKNLVVLETLVQAAAQQGARLVVTPEMTNVLDKQATRLLAHLDVEIDLYELTAYARLARQYAIYLLIGSVAVALGESAEGAKAANRSYLFGPDGTIIATYDKLHMFDVVLSDKERWTESTYYQPGERLVVADTAIAPIGFSICYDLRFACVYRKLAQAGACIMSVPAAFTQQTGEAHWKTLLRARAIETGSFVIAAAQGGKHEDGRTTWGHSMIVSPWGKICAMKADATPGIVTADLDISQVEVCRTKIPSLFLDRTPKTVTVS